MVKADGSVAIRLTLYKDCGKSIMRFSRLWDSLTRTGPTRKLCLLQRWKFFSPFIIQAQKRGGGRESDIFYSFKWYFSIVIKTINHYQWKLGGGGGVITTSEGILSVFQQLVATVISNQFSWAFCSLQPHCFWTNRKGMRKPGCNSERAAFGCREQHSGVAQASRGR